MQSYLKYKEYNDRKAKAAPLGLSDYCFILQPLADHQGSKIPSWEFRWIGPYVIEKVLPNENYIVRKLNSNKTQFYIESDYKNTRQTLLYETIARKAICKRMTKSSSLKTIYTLFHGKQILTIFLHLMLQKASRTSI